METTAIAVFNIGLIKVDFLYLHLSFTLCPFDDFINEDVGISSFPGTSYKCHDFHLSLL
jgi:hypothetical protein